MAHPMSLCHFLAITSAMDSGYISAVAALVGSVIGGLTSLAASWVSQNTQARTQQLIGDKSRRQELYKAFIEEAAKLYADALVSEKLEVAKLVGLYAMASRMRILSAPAVFDKADKVIQAIVDTYSEPNRAIDDLRGAIHSHNLDPLRNFSEACREDLTGPGIKH
ncbi:MAG TPA: hypothetical protein VMQ73_04255 [Methylomirabilota bacterium]|nr:hypothetical protein [Methylomirabilota bacterium]